MSGNVLELLTQAETDYASGQFDNAQEKLKKALELDPQNYDAGVRLADIYAVRGLINSVANQYFAIVNGLEAKGDLRKALDVCGWILKIDPENTDARMKIILIYQKLNDKHEVIRQSLALARLLIELGQGDQAILLLQRTQSGAHDNLEIGSELAEIYISYGHIPESIIQYKKIAASYLTKGLTGKASEVYKRLKLVVPEEKEVMLALGKIYIEQNQYKEAEAEFRNVLRLDLNNVEALMLLGEVCHKKGQYKDAVLAFTKVISLDSQEVRAIEKLGALYQDQGKVRESVEHFVNAAQNYQLLGNIDKSIKIYQRILIMDPTNPVACRELTNLGAPLASAEVEEEVARISKAAAEEAAHVPAPGVVMPGMVMPGAGAPGVAEVKEEVARISKAAAEEAAHVPAPGVETPGMVMPGVGAPGEEVIISVEEEAFAEEEPLIIISEDDEEFKKLKKEDAKVRLDKHLLKTGLIKPVKEEKIPIGLIKDRAKAGVEDKPGLIVPKDRDESIRRKTGLIKGKLILSEILTPEGKPSEEQVSLTQAPAAPVSETPVSETPVSVPGVGASAREEVEVAGYEKPFTYESVPAPSAEPLMPEAPVPEVPEAEVPSAQVIPADEEAMSAPGVATPVSAPGVEAPGVEEPVGFVESAITSEFVEAIFGEKPEEIPIYEAEAVEALPLPEEILIYEAGAKAPSTPVSSAPVSSAEVPLAPAPSEIEPEEIITEEAEVIEEAPGVATPVSAPGAEEPEIEQAVEAEEIIEPAPVSPPPSMEEAEAIEEALAEPIKEEAVAVGAAAEVSEAPVSAPCVGARIQTREASLEKLLNIDKMAVIGKAGEAIEECVEHLTNNPDDNAMRFELGKIYLEKGLADYALEIFYWLSQKDKENTEYLKAIIHALEWKQDFAQLSAYMYQLAGILSKQDKINELIRVYQDIILLEENNLDIRYKLADLYLKQGQNSTGIFHLESIAEGYIINENLNKAIEVYRKVFSETRDLSVQEKLAYLYKANHRIAESIEQYRQLTRIYREQGLREKEISATESIIELDGEDLEARIALSKLIVEDRHENNIHNLFSIAVIYSSRKNKENAKIYFEKVLNIDETYVPAHDRLIDIYFELNDKERALTHANFLINNYLGEKRYNEAIEIYKRLIRYDPDNVAMRTELSKMYVLAQSKEKAVEELVGLIKELSSRGKWEEVVHIYKKAIELDEENFDFRFNLGLIYLERLNRLKDAASSFVRALRITPRDAKTAQYLLNVYLKLDEPYNVIDAYKKLITIDASFKVMEQEIINKYVQKIESKAENFMHRYNLGIIYKELGMIDNAIEQFQAAKKQPDLLLKSYNMLGLCFNQKEGAGMFDLAIRQFKRALEIKGYPADDYFELKYNLGKLYIERHMHKEAKSYLEEIYKQNKKYRDVAEKLKMIKEIEGKEPLA